MTTTRKNRWSFEAVLDANDKVRIRGFVKNEIAYYNGLLAGFASRLRTMPEVFDEVPEDFLGTIAQHGYSVRALTPDNLPAPLARFRNMMFQDGRLALSDRVALLLDVVSAGAVLHPEVRRAMAVEMLHAHQRQAEGLSRTTNRVDQVLAAPVELLHPIEARIKRHIQLPKAAVLVSPDGRSFQTRYNAKPIVLRPQGLPEDASWNLLVLRDDEQHGVGSWTAEFRQETASYLTRLTDVPFNTKKRKKAEPTR